jgi:ADP-ribose pyrophosphatase YjhB (NUDIX family)
MKYINSIGAKAIIFNEKNELLLCYEKDSWSIPGGTVEGGENLKDACKREVYEETGFYIYNPEKLLGIAEGIVFDAKNDITIQWYVFFFLCKIQGSSEINKNWQDHDLSVKESKFFTEEQFFMIETEKMKYVNKSLWNSFERIKNFNGEIFDSWNIKI